MSPVHKSHFRGGRWQLAIAFALLFSLLHSGSASAQDRGFALNRFDGSTFGSSTFLLERPWYSGARFLAVGLTADYSHAPLVPRASIGGAAISPIIEHALTGHLDVAGSLFNRVLLSASLPVAILETGTPQAVTQVLPASTFTVGDPRVSAMIRLFGEADFDPISLHVGADVWLPIGAAATHFGDTGLRLQPRAVLAGSFLSHGRWAVEGSFLFRNYASLGPATLGLLASSEARGGASLGLSLLNDRITIGPEARISAQVVGDNALKTEGMNLEVLGAAQVLIADNFQLGLAGGTAFLGAPGTTDLRGVVRLGWAPRHAHPRESLFDEPNPFANDADHDGVTDDFDRCPFEPETRNGIRDEDGCPEYEMDQGSVLARVLNPKANPPPLVKPQVPRVVPVAPVRAKALDAGQPVTALPTLSSPGVDGGTPSAPVTPNAPDAGPALPAAVTPVATAEPALPVAPDGGALDPAQAYALADSDGDGVVDEADRCPAIAEDIDDFEDEDGCPELDNDADAIADAVDQCPNDAETFNLTDDDDGCPDLAPDADDDGVADAIDRCPFEPETRNGLRDNDGCPEIKAPNQAALAQILSGRRPETPLAPPPEAAAEPPTTADIDSDKDGVPDDADRCPVTAEDADGFEDEDGCPEDDNDSDGIADASDKCPADAETLNGWKDDDGCPDEHEDIDGDGVLYASDRCPFEPGIAPDGCPHAPLPALAVDGFPGLVTAAVAPGPEATPVAAPAAVTADFDKDSITDDADPCPGTSEDRDGFEDDDGCPEPDNDHDGIDDKTDKCPLAAETINGVKDDDGCPDVGAGVVSIQKNAVVIDGIVRFKTGSAQLTPQSMPLLAQVASTLKAASALSIEIQGHTDDVGNAAANITLSKKRADAIRAVLIKAGVKANRLVAKGYGPTRPRASNKTPEGREQNRRVEFLILGEKQ